MSNTARTSYNRQQPNRQTYSLSKAPSAQQKAPSAQPRALTVQPQPKAPQKTLSSAPSSGKPQKKTPTCKKNMFTVLDDESEDEEEPVQEKKIPTKRWRDVIWGDIEESDDEEYLYGP